jgi:hypothetical protein
VKEYASTAFSQTRVNTGTSQRIPSDVQSQRNAYRTMPTPVSYLALAQGMLRRNGLSVFPIHQPQWIQNRSQIQAEPNLVY